MENKNKLTKEFEKIRDIPYRISLSFNETDDSCSGKAEKLFNFFQKNGFDVRYRICLFRWNDLNLPNKLRKLSYENNSSHMYLEVKIDRQWKIVDATWDKNLSKIFQINDWDGISNTKIAVPATKILSPKESLAYIKKTSTPEEITADLKTNGELYKTFNDWLEEVRKESHGK